MSEMLSPKTRLWIDILWAGHALVIETYLIDVGRYIRGAFALFFINIPQNALVANDLRWAAVFLVWHIIFTFIMHRGFSRKAFSDAYSQGHSALVWVLICVLYFRLGTPASSRPTGAHIFDPWIYPSDENKWMHSVYWVLSLMSHSKVPKYVLIRTYMKFRRVDRLAFYFKNWFIEGSIVDAIYLTQRYEDHILQLFATCLWLPVEQFIFNIILSVPIRLWFGFDKNWSWKYCNPTYLQMFIRLLYHWQYDLRPKLRRGAIFDNVQDSEKEFEYVQLEDTGTIRLLVLHRRHMADTVNCTLFDVPLDKAPYYEAISYTWSDSLEKCNIRVNGRRLAIPKSAYRVLKSRSSFWVPRVLWIDSICINQSDDEEKLSQIKMMKDIYGKAFMVSVCLHPPENVENEILEYVESGLAAYLVNELLWTDLNFYANEKAIFDTYAPSVRQPRWAAFKNLVRNEWFNRVWVVQEVALADRVRVLYGKTEMPWQVLVDVMGICGNHASLASLLETTPDPAVRKTLPSLSNAIIMNSFRKMKTGEESGSLSFSSALYRCYHLQASNPRDKVFGIQGFCTGDDKRLDANGIDDQYLISPNYQKDTKYVYIDVARYLLAREAPLRLLSYAGIGFHYGPSKSGELPSWCPDWSRQPLSRRLSYTGSGVDYHAGGEDNMPPRIARSIKFPSLMLRGQVIDTIKSLGPDGFLAISDETGTWQAQYILNMYQCAVDCQGIVLDLPFKGKMYPYTNSPQPLLEAYWRTLSGDRNDKERPAPESCGEDYQNWLDFGRMVSLMNISQNPWLPVTTESPRLAGTEPGFATVIWNCAMGRKLCTTKLGYIGFVPPLVAKDDVICLIQGAQVPFVLRSAQGSGSGSVNISVRQYQLVGEAYVHGIMDGELIGREYEELKMEDLEII